MIRVKIDAEKLRGFLDCMHDEADEREKHSAQIRAIVKAAKEVGYDTKAIRKVFARERMEEAVRIQQDDLLETYEHALGGKGRALVAIAEGVPVGEAAKTNGVHRATVARARHVAKQASNATPHDPETGEILRPMTEDDLGKLEIVHSEVQPDARPMTADDLGDPLLVIDKERGKFREKIRVAAAAIRADRKIEPEIVSPVDTRTAAEVMGEMPTFLRRERATA